MAENKEPPSKIGPYQILRTLGKGGMGEVFLAVDPLCGRLVALKKIREDMRDNKLIQGRFLKEAKIAARLTHPAIMPIYTIHAGEDGPLFYTMPYVEGQTLRQIVRVCIDEEKEGEVLHPIGSSIPALVRIFFSVCGAIAYCHAKNILHRDLKLDNIIIGKYGEVLILDWGLAHIMGEDPTLPKPDKNIHLNPEMNLTRPGKIAGTLSYLAPERLFHAPPSCQTDIYSLGVILYQLLTLKTPFHRPSIQVFRKKVKTEKLHNLHEVAPYRNIPPHLADITKKCLEPDPKKRYQSVEDLIIDLTNYIEGKPEWIPAATLKIDCKSDWEFQENILLSKRKALSGALDSIEWVSLMISKASFSDNIRIDSTICLKETGAGIGFLIGVPDMEERSSFEEGYCLWIGSESKPMCKLFRSNVEVMDMSHSFLKAKVKHQLSIEKTGNKLRFYIDGKLICHYISHIPLRGSHLGLLYKDGDFELSPLEISVGSRNVMVSCLAVPDAFLASKNYAKALTEYRKIRSAFTGRKEAEEAIFRAGITLLEEARLKSSQEKKRLCSCAFDEFSGLRETPAAPLEYLGKALVYQFLSDIEEEMKCLELGLRKYPKHPMLKIVSEHIIFRLHETASKDRLAAFHYALLTLRHLPNALSSEEGVHLLDALKKHLEPLSLFTPLTANYAHTDLAIQLAFYIGKPLILIELFESQIPSFLKANICFALLSLGYRKWVKNHYDQLTDPEEKTLLKEVILAEDLNVQTSPLLLSDHPSARRAAFYLIDTALKMNKPQTILAFATSLQGKDVILDSCLIRAHLLLHNWSAAEKLLLSYSSDARSDVHSPLFPLMGALLWQRQGKKSSLAHFSQSASASYLTSTIPSFFGSFQEKLTASWHAKTPFYEKIELFHYLQILYECAGEQGKSQRSILQIKREIQRVRNQNTYS